MKKIFTIFLSSLIALTLAIPSVFATSIDVEGSANNGFRLANDLGIQSTSITVICWMSPTAQPATNADTDFCAHSTAVTGVDDFLGYQDSGGTKRVYYARDKNGIVANQLNFNVTLNIGQWYMIVGTWDGATMTLYLDGVNEGTLASSGNGNGGDQTAVVAGYLPHASGNIQPCSCRLSNMEIYNAAITSAQVNNLRFRRPRDNESNLVLYWRLDESGGPTTFDHTSNARNGAATTSIWAAISPPAQLLK